jgi:hypothetical protein
MKEIHIRAIINSYLCERLSKKDYHIDYVLLDNDRIKYDIEIIQEISVFTFLSELHRLIKDFQIVSLNVDFNSSHAFSYVEIWLEPLN